MSFGKNLQYLRRLNRNMTQEAIAEKLDVSRQTVSKWESDECKPEIDKAIALCSLFNCTLDNLFREELNAYDEMYSNLRVETVPAFRYVIYTVISADPESDALDKITKIAKDNGDQDPKIIGWDFPYLSQEQINVYKMHGYTAAWMLPADLTPDGLEVREQKAQSYAAVHIESPFDNPFVTIPNGYKTIDEYMKINGLKHVWDGIIPCFETSGESMDIYIACE
ncbi:MAG: helix-turn-helix transcriptional regulator [Oscillospiraceae bacterium]